MDNILHIHCQHGHKLSEEAEARVSSFEILENERIVTGMLK